MSEAVLEASVRARRGQFLLELELRCGFEPLVIVGPNAAGKTSLLRVLLGALRPDAGRIALHGRVLFDSAQSIDVPVELRGLGYVPQGYGLFPHLSALQNVELPLALAAQPAASDTRKQRALELLERFDAAALADRMPHTLSGGEQQRIALARALAAGPRALLLDEPLAALDVSARRVMRERLAADLAALGLPALIVTHDPDDARALGAQVAVIERGKIVQRGSFETLRRAPATAYVEELTRTAAL